jgi:MoaA/NifB/PqqE/SkfB family radical SAM enzyme
VREQALVDIWNSPAMNDLRIQHLEGRRKEHPVCGKCGQLSHCLPDNIDAHALMLLERMQRFLGRS